MPLTLFGFTRFRLFSSVAVLGAGLSLAGCADDPTGAAAYIERPVEQIYNDAWAQIGRENWIQAAQQFDEVERQHPYSIWARRAVLMAAYSYYQGNRYDEAVQTATTFI